MPDTTTGAQETQAASDYPGSPTIPSTWLSEADAIAPPSDSLYSTEDEVRRHERARTLRECAERLLKPPEWLVSVTPGRAARVNDHDFMHPGQLHAPGYCTSCDRRREEVAVSREDLRLVMLAHEDDAPSTEYDEARKRLRAVAAAGDPR